MEISCFDLIKLKVEGGNVSHSEVELYQVTYLQFFLTTRFLYLLGALNHMAYC